MKINDKTLVKLLINNSKRALNYSQNPHSFHEIILQFFQFTPKTKKKKKKKKGEGGLSYDSLFMDKIQD